MGHAHRQWERDLGGEGFRHYILQSSMAWLDSFRSLQSLSETLDGQARSPEGQARRIYSNSALKTTGEPLRRLKEEKTFDRRVTGLPSRVVQFRRPRGYDFLQAVGVSLDTAPASQFLSVDLFSHTLHKPLGELSIQLETPDAATSANLEAREKGEPK
jgi:hypothetical protein